MSRITKLCSHCSKDKIQARIKGTGEWRIPEYLFVILNTLGHPWCVLLFPVAITVTVFLVLYNNVWSGRLILLVLMLINLTVLLAPCRNYPRFAAIRPAKPVALWLLVGLVTILGIELAFPICLPFRYAEVRDLTKQWTCETMQVEAEGAVLFTNSDQRIQCSKQARGAVARIKPWHSAGGEFAYYGYDPNSKIRYVNLFHWNSRGYFDHDYQPARPEGITRIVVIGDSYVEAMQVPLARTFHKLLESALNQGVAHAGSSKYEVVALGSAGTGQNHNLHVLRKEGLAFGPDMVVFTLCSNDFCDDDPKLKKEFDLAFGAITPLVRGLAGHGYFAAAFACRRIEDLQRNRIAVSPELLQWVKDDIPKVEIAWTRTLDYVREARNFCRQRGIAFTLVYLGSDLEVKYALDPVGTITRLKAMGGPHEKIIWDMEKSVRRVTTFCDRNNIRVVSMLGPLIAAQRETGNQVFSDHYTLFGHQVVARVLRCALDLGPEKYGGAGVSFRDCTSPEEWGPVAPVTVIDAPGEPSAAAFVPAAGP